MHCEHHHPVIVQRCENLLCGRSRQIIYYLSGLTCTDENVIQKCGIQRKAAELGVAIVAPDTSPRGLNVYAPRRRPSCMPPTERLADRKSLCCDTADTLGRRRSRAPYHGPLLSRRAALGGQEGVL